MAYISEMNDRLPNSKMIVFKETEHEIFMEKDTHRKKSLKEIENFLNN